MPSHARDYYKVLQVDPEAEAEVIAAAYRRLSLKYHPDTNRAADATLRMQLINEAYDVLKDPARRARYDRERAAQAPAPEGHARHHTHPGSQAEPAEADVPGFHAFKAAPRGARVVKSFAVGPLYSQGSSVQEHSLPAGCWIDLGFEWIARDVATVTTTWRALNIDITIDGVLVTRSQRQTKGPDPIVLPNPQGLRYGYVVADALYLPPLPPGDHVIKWTVTFEREVDDGWTVHPRGSALAVTSTLHIGKSEGGR